MVRILLLLGLICLVGCSTTSVPSYYSATPQRSGSGDALLPDGSRYTGKFKSGLFHGVGKLIYASGDEYEGQFVAGLFQGQGEFSSISDWQYSGSFRAGTFDGAGSLVRANGDKYSGQFKDDLMHGTGRYQSVDGAIYSGEFAKNQTVLAGVIEYEDGSRYDGEWADWAPSGEGVYTDDDGTIYTGPFVSGTPQGGFDIRYADGSHFRGEMTDWWSRGEGVFTATNGDQYTGNFSSERYSGLGILRKADGVVYEGEFRNGVYHGAGTLSWVSDQGPKTLSGPWYRGKYQGLDRADYVAQGIAAPDAENLMFHQQQLLDAALNQMQASTPGIANNFALTVAGHGRQDVFRKESELARVTIAQQFDTANRTLSLVNHPRAALDQPLATTTNLRYALNEIGQKMDRAEDVLFLFLTSHGSSDHKLSFNLPGEPMQSLSAQALAQMLDSADIRWRVIMVSACYSGGFIAPLRNEQTIVVTSARADRTSFGCSDDADLTFFGKAFLEQSLNGISSIEDAFFNARKLVADRERQEGFKPSEPQIHIGNRIRTKLRQIAKKTDHNTSTPLLTLSQNKEVTP